MLEKPLRPMLMTAYEKCAPTNACKRSALFRICVITGLLYGTGLLHNVMSEHS